MRSTSAITCPPCGFTKEEEMPINSCQHFYTCTHCKVVLKPKQGDCCVFCSYGDTPCPLRQAETVALPSESAWQERRAMSMPREETKQAHRYILTHFARLGRSPTIQEIQQALQLPESTAAETLVYELERQKLIHRQADDPLIIHAYPFSSAPTDHKILLANGVEVFAMCAIDALGIPFMLDMDVSIGSTCAQCERAICVEIKQKQLIRVEPRRVVVVYAQAAECCNISAIDYCPYVNFCCSQEHAQLWLQAHSSLQRTGYLTMAVALEKGKQIFGNLLQDDSSMIKLLDDIQRGRVG